MAKWGSSSLACRRPWVQSFAQTNSMVVTVSLALGRWRLEDWKLKEVILSYTESSSYLELSSSRKKRKRERRERARACIELFFFFPNPGGCPDADPDSEESVGVLSCLRDECPGGLPCPPRDFPAPEMTSSSTKVQQRGQCGLCCHGDDALLIQSIF